MSRVDTHTDAAVVNKNQHSKRETFPDPKNGFELGANLLRSEQQAALTVNERYLYLLLADYVGDAKLSCFPAVSTLAKTMGIKERSMRRMIHKLEKKGFLKIKPRNEGKVQSNIYTLVPASKVVGVTLGSGVGVTDGSPVALTGGSAKETSGKETKSKENTPQTPQGGMSESFRLFTEVSAAVADVCSDDKQLTLKTVHKRAKELIEYGYDAARVYALTDYIWAECRGNYTGPLRPHQLVNYSGDEAVDNYLKKLYVKSA